jgi:hypothetical protein
MGIFDFLGKDVAGYNQGPMPSGEAGVPRSGITWGDIAKAALLYGSGIPMNMQGRQQQTFGGLQQIGPQEQKKQGGSGDDALFNSLMSYFLG